MRRQGRNHEAPEPDAPAGCRRARRLIPHSYRSAPGHTAPRIDVVLAALALVALRVHPSAPFLAISLPGDGPTGPPRHR
jgi:hypothetical protein